MRMTRYHLYLLGWVLLMLAGPVAFTQFPGGGGGKGGKGGFGRGGMDGLFNMYSGGADTFDVNKVQIPEFMTRMKTAEKYKEEMMAFLQKKGVTNGQMTKDLFSEFSMESFREMGKRRNESNFQKLAAGKDRFNVDTVDIPQDMQRFEQADAIKAKMKDFLTQKGVKDGQMTMDLYQEYSEGRMREFGERMAKGEIKMPERGGPPGGASDAENDQRAKEQFDAIDTNKDGKLSTEELKTAQDNRLRGTRVLDSFDLYDKNKDKFIDLEEYKAYYKDRMGGRDRPGDPAAPAPGQVPEEEKRPTVYRNGKLPKDLPTWFEPMDSDKDAQVGLYEWKKSGRTVKEFLDYDTNGDGFLTVEELQRVEKAKLKKPAEPTTGVAFGGNPGFGGPPAFGAPPGAGGGGPPAFMGGPRPGGGGGADGARMMRFDRMRGDKGGKAGPPAGGMDWMNKGKRGEKRGDKGGKGGRPPGA